MNPAISCKDLSCCYDKSPVLWDVSLAVPRGVLCAIIGPNGAGKSTFLKACVDLIKPFSGKVTCFGKPFKKSKDRIAYVPQKEMVDWEFPITVLEVVLMGRYNKLGMFRLIREADKDAANKVMKLLGIDHLKDRQISELSGGQQQRVFMARALMQDADLYLLDEPFAGIDAATEMTLTTLFKDLKEKGKTIVIVHHDLQCVRALFDYVIFLNTRLIAYGKTKDVFTRENLCKTYGKKGEILTEVVGLVNQNQQGH